MGSPNNYDGVEIVEQPPQILDDDNDKPHGYCVKYIEAVRSAHFKFVVNKQSKFKRYGHHMAYNVQIDGSFTELDHEHDQESRKQVSRDPWQGITAGYFVGDFDSPEGIQEKLFRFNDLRIVEDNIPLSVEELGEERDRVKDCGTLRVSLYHMSRSDRIGNTRSLNRQLGETPPITVVNQKVLDELVNEGIVPPAEVVEQVTAMSEAERRRLLERLLAEDIQRRRTATPFEEIQQRDIKPEPPSP